MDHRSTCKVILLYIKSLFFLAGKKNISFFFLYISVFVVKVQCFEDTCVKREIDTDAVVLNVCSVCVCLCSVNIQSKCAHVIYMHSAWR